jgi:hypothetical protein
MVDAVAGARQRRYLSEIAALCRHAPALTAAFTRR